MKTATPANKLPQISALFWVMKICATTLGETGGDLMSMTLKVGYAVSSMILIGFFIVSVTGQLAARSYLPPLFWTVILATSMAGTTMSDFMDRTLGFGYVAGTAVLVTLLCAVLGIWRLVTGSLSVDHIRDRRAESFYWAAILVSNTLGTALGDFLADSSGLGFTGGALLISGLLGVILLLYFFTGASRVGLFWAAFVLTRPFGATFGDLLTKGHEKGGLGFGTTGSSLVLVVLLMALIVWVTTTQGRRPVPTA